MLSHMRSEDCLQDVFEKVRVKLHLHTNKCKYTMVNSI